MNRIKFAVGATLVAISAVALAAEPSSDAARQQRMDAALQNYHDAHPDTTARSSSTAGPAARAEESAKRGARKAGHAVAHGARKAGHAVAQGARKTGDAMRRTGEKMGGTSKSNP